MDLGSASVPSLYLSVLVSGVGLGFFLYGKKQSRFIQLLGGLAMMAYPYFVTSLAWMGGIFVALLAAMWLAAKSGM